MLYVILEHGPNPDFDGGYHAEPRQPRVVERKVETLVEAREVFIKWRDWNQLGGGNMTRRSGSVYDGVDVIARISYNGRVWTPEEWPACKEIKL